MGVALGEHVVMEMQEQRADPRQVLDCSSGRFTRFVGESRVWRAWNCNLYIVPALELEAQGGAGSQTPTAMEPAPPPFSVALQIRS